MYEYAQAMLAANHQGSSYYYNALSSYIEAAQRNGMAAEAVPAMYEYAQAMLAANGEESSYYQNALQSYLAAAERYR
jgi:cytochrome c2